MSTPQTPPRASLTTLPTEIKAKIVEMAYLQQEAWKERDPAGFRTAFETDDAETRSRWHPLSLVSKEFRELAAPHIFSTLRSHRSLDPSFRLYVQPRHAKSISVVQLDRSYPSETDGAALERAFELLSLLPGLRELHISYGAQAYLFGSPEDANPTEEQSVRLCNFNTFGGRLVRLQLESGSLPLPLATAMLRASPSLRSLRFWIEEFIEDDEQCSLESFLDAISSLRDLVELDITLGILLEPGSWATRHWTPPPIKHLKLDVWHRSLSLALAGLFADTLETLRTVWCEESPSAPVLATPLQLPHLTTLEIVDSGCDRKTESQLLETFQASPLLSISYVTSHGNPIDSNTALETFLNRQPNLRKINIVGEKDWRNMTPSELAAYADLVDSRGLEADFEDDAHNPFAPEANLEYGEDEIEYLAEALDRTLYFGRQDVERMVRDKDVAKAVRWVGVLGALEGERRRWKD